MTESEHQREGIDRGLPSSPVLQGSGFDSALLGRVRFFLRTIFFVHLALTGVGTVLILAETSGKLSASEINSLLLAHSMTVLVGALLWLSTWRGWGTFSAQAMAGVGTLVLTVGYPVAIGGASNDAQEDYLFTLVIIIAVLVLRSSLVPSPALTTAVLGFLALTLPCVQVYRLTNWDFLIWYALLSIIFIIITSVTSQVVYGMQLSLQVATRLGQYDIEKAIGRGAMGDVFLARHALLKRQTALKLLREVTSNEARSLFQREVQTASVLTHPNTVEIFDYGRTSDGVFFFAMEYVEGASLQQIVDATGPMSPERVVYLLHQAAGSLGEAHHRGFVHRDVKPSNLMVCERGGRFDTIKVTDFGLVHDVNEFDAQTALRGTPLYLAPESIVDTAQVSPQSDVYALGATAFFLLTGRPPFENDDLVELLSDHIASPPPDIVGVDSQLTRIVSKCLEKNPQERYSTANDFAVALEACALFGKWSNRFAEIWWAENRALVAAHGG
ncbi:MAG: serine/threonine-protein kinase [Myxococcota bacterium]